MLNDKEIELVRRFHESDLSEEELVLINRRIETEPDFKEEVEKLGLIRDTIIQLVKHEQGDKTIPIINKDKSENKRKRWFLPLAACLLLLIGCFAYYQYALIQTNEQIFADCETFTYSISSDIMRAGAPNANTALLSKEDEAALQRIINNYKNKDLGKAEKEAQLLKSTSEDMVAQEIVAWWLVTIYLQEKETGKAKVILEEITKNPDFNSKSTALEILESL